VCTYAFLQEYRTSVSNYVELLSKHLPTGKNLQEEELQTLCATINTGDYIQDRCAELGNVVVAMLAGQTVEQLALTEAAAAEAAEAAEGGNTEDPEADIDPTYRFIAALREQVDLSSVDEQVSHLNHRATHVLAANIVRKLQGALAHMRDKSSLSSSSSHGNNGSASVSDENKYVREIQSLLRAQLQDKARMSSFAYLAQVVAVDFLKEYNAALRGISLNSSSSSSSSSLSSSSSSSSSFRITEQVAQQMLLDLQSLKNFLVHAVQDWRREAQMVQTQGRRAKEHEDMLQKHANGDLGDTGGSSGGAGNGAQAVAPAFKAYVKLLHQQVQPSELLLKVLTSPSPRLISTLKAINPAATEAQVYEVLQLRGLSASEQEKLVKAYNQTQPDPRNHITIIKRDFFNGIGQSVSQMVRDVKHSMH